MSRNYTVKDLADILDVSKTTIQKYIKASAIDYDYIEKNKQYYNEEKAVEIIKGIRKDFDISQLEIANLQTANRKPQTEDRQLKNENKAETQAQGDVAQSRKPQTENQQPQTENRQQETIDRIISMLEKELEEKNRQLEVKDKQIQDLADRLAEALALTSQQQFISAVDKQQQLMEAEKEEHKEEVINISKDNIEPVENKKGFFARLFKK